MPKAATPRSVTAEAPLSEPEFSSGALRDPVLETPDATAKRMIAGLYAATRAAVEAWGGQSALASLWGCSLTNVNDRINRREPKGVTSYAFLDFLALALTAPAAQDVVVPALCDLCGFEPPKRKRIKTDAEKLRGLVKSLKDAGELGEAAIARAARKIGADPSEYDL